MDDIYKYDWYKRDDDYVFRNDVHENWNFLNDKLSEFIYPRTIVDAIINSKKACQFELNNICNLLGLHAQVFVDENNNESYTDGKNIVVSKKLVSDETDCYSQLDLLIGLCLHEAAHCKYTDFGYINAHKKSIDKSIIRWLHNVIEDELIERHLGYEHPGYSNFIKKVKYHLFDKHGELLSSKPVNQLDEILRLFLYIIRYPKYITSVNHEILSKYADIISNIKDILRDNMCLNVMPDKHDTIFTLNAAISIYELLRKYFNCNNTTYSGDIFFDVEISTDNDSEREGETLLSDISSKLKDCSSESSAGDSENDTNNDGVKNENTIGGGSTSDNRNDGVSFEDMESQVLSDISTLKLHEKLLQECSSTSELQYNRNTSTVKQLYEYELNHGKMIVNVNNGLYSAPKRQKSILRYNSLLSTVKEFIPLAKNIIIDSNTYKDCIEKQQFRRNGGLDTTRLVEAIQNQNNVFTQQVNIKQKANDPNIALVLIMDESGSMKDIHNFVTSIVICIYEALRYYPKIELYIYGHGDCVNTYIDKTHKDKYILGDCGEQNGQNESHAYTAIFESVMSQTSLPIVFINFTDSCYCETTGLKVLFDEYRTKHNASFNLVCIGNDDKNVVTPVNDELYGEGNWVIISDTQKKDIKNMIMSLSKLVKKNYNNTKLRKH